MTVEHAKHQHKHDHEHAHEHNHGHIDDLGILIIEHEGALVASLNLEFAGSIDDVEQVLATKLEALAAEVAKTGWVGHIKATIQGDAAISTLSTTGGAVHITRGKDTVAKADIVAIVLGVAETDLRQALASTLLG
jgi:hypothetical protein